MRLAEPLGKYDYEVVHEFYANAWIGGVGTQEMQSRVRGRWAPFDRDSINSFLRDPLQLRGVDDYSYHQLRARTYGFNDDIVAREICLANHSYEITPGGKPWRILRKHMKTLSQVWIVLMLANIVPIGYMSDLNIPRCHLLCFLLKDDYFVDVAKIIGHEIYNFFRLEVSQNNEKANGFLGFPALIIILCAVHGVEVNSSIKIKPPIDLKFIVNNCNATEEQAPEAGDVPIHHSPIHHPGSSSSSREDRILEQMQKMQLEQRATWEHIQMQESANHRGIVRLQQDIYQNFP